MESNDTANTRDLFVKLTQLEEQVAELSSQLEFQSITIGQLKQSLTDRDSQISDLEAKLSIAHNSLRNTTSVILFQTREQLLKGCADIKVVSSVLDYIQKYIELVQGFANETQDFIHHKYEQVHYNFKTALELLQKAPEQVHGYFQKHIVVPADNIVKTTLKTADSHYKAGQEWLQHKLVDPGMALLDQIAFLARELPLDARLTWQQRVIDPALSYMDKLPTVVNGIRVDISAWIKALLRQLSSLMQQCLNSIEEQIKKSSFWDGQNRMHQAGA